MKCIILLTLVAICYSYPLGSGSGRSVNINEDGTIVITQANGKKITINKGITTTGQKAVDITVSGPYIPTKRIQINEDDQSGVRRGGEYNEVSDEYLRDKRSSKDKKQRSQSDTLTKILKGYQGEVDQGTYQRLLSEINAAVQDGQLSSSIYDELRNLDQGQLEQEGIWNRQQGIIGGQQQVNVLDLLRERAIEKELQEQQLQQLLLQQGQKSQVVLDVPVGVDEQGRQIVERVLIPRSQVGTGLGLRGLSDIRGVSGQQGLSGIITGTGPRTVGTLSGVRGLLEGRQTQWGQVGSIGQPILVKLTEIIQDEREILDGQRQIQQQQLQQQQQQQELLVQQIIQQQQQQQQQLQQQLLQQLQEQQLREQERLLEQQNQQLTWRDILVNGGRSGIQSRVQQGLWQQQQPGVYSQRGFLERVGQGIPIIQRDVPLIL